MGDAVMKKGSDEQRQQSTKGCSFPQLRNAAAGCFFFFILIELFDCVLNYMS